MGMTVTGHIDVSEVDLHADAPLQIAAVEEGRVVAATPLESKQDVLVYELELPFDRPCGFVLLVGRADVNDRQLLATPLIQQQVTADQLRPRKGGPSKAGRKPKKRSS